MKYLRIAFYLLRQSCKNIWKNLFMVFASIVVVFSVLGILGGLYTVSRNVQTVIDQFSDRAEVQINFAYYVTDESAREYLDVIRSDNRVQAAEFVSKEENFERLLAYFADEKELFETYRDSETLQFSTIEVELVQFADGETFVEEAKQLPGVDNVKDIVGTVEKMEVVRFWVRIGTIVAMIVMLVLSVLLIFNTVKLTVIARKSEIEIMKYIGATDAYIGTPFVMEGVITGLVGAFLSFLALRGIYTAIYNGMFDMLSSANIRMLTFREVGGSRILLVFLGFGALTGFVASMWAAHRHMNV